MSVSSAPRLDDDFLWGGVTRRQGSIAKTKTDTASGEVLRISLLLLRARSILCIDCDGTADRAASPWPDRYPATLHTMMVRCWDEARDRYIEQLRDNGERDPSVGAQISPRPTREQARKVCQPLQFV